MAKPTPIPTAQRALATAIKALESISISTGIKGTAIKLGNEFVTDTNAVLNDLADVKEDAQALVNGLNTMLNKLKETAIPVGPVHRGLCNEIPVHTPTLPFVGFSEVCVEEDGEDTTDDSLAPSEFIQAELNSTVPIERTTAPELFAASPSF